jgi:hypothetical protein
MKRIIIIFVIVLLLISVLTNTILTKDGHYNYREVWNSWTDYQRYVYLWGFNDGTKYAAYKFPNGAREITGAKALSVPELNKAFNFADKLTIIKITSNITSNGDVNINFEERDLKIIRDIVSDLYSDPANAYIRFEDIIFIAIDKLSGKPIEKMLEIERKEAVD